MSEQTENPQEAPPGKKKRPKSLLYTIVLGVLLILLAVPYAYTSNPKSCTRCHDMQKYYDSWKKSSHATAANNCFHCHVKQGALNLFIYRVSFYREIYASMVGADLKPIGASLPGVDSCQRKGCHSLNRVTSESGDIKINHKLHVLKANVSCTTCHPGAAHPRVGNIGDLVPKRKLCFNCHAERRNECSFCHNKRFAFSSQFSH